MSKSRFFIFAAGCFAAGILLQSQFNFNRAILIVAIACGFMALALSASSRSQTFTYMSLWVISMLAGIGRMQLAIKPNEYQAILGTKQQVDAIIVADVDLRVDKQLLTVRPESFQQNILITADKGSRYSYGDRLWLSGKITEPKSDEEFDYKAYLLRWNTYALMNRPKIIVLQNNQGHWWLRGLLGIKYAFIHQVNRVLPEVESNLLLGILIGARKGLPTEVIDNFNATGVSHIIAISGYNISILAASLGFLDRRIGRKINFWITLGIIAAFIIMSGASASVIRAGFMGALALFSGRVGRLYAITPSLCAAAVVMLLLNPRILYWDASFQLSFLATAGVVYIAPLAEELTDNWPSLFGLKSILLTTLAAIAATLPFMLFQFGRLSLVAPLVNILILPLVPTTMLFGFLTGLPMLGFGFGLIAHWLLWYMLRLTPWFAHLPHASAVVHVNRAIFLAGYALLILAYTLASQWSKHRPARGSLPSPQSMLQ